MITLAPKFHLIKGLGPPLTGVGGRSLESIGREIDREEDIFCFGLEEDKFNVQTEKKEDFGELTLVLLPAVEWSPAPIHE